MQFAARVITVLALCLAIGLHWIALQSVAWTTMLVSNTKQTTSLTRAVAKTFDGNHPCDLCKRISSAQHSQKKPEAQPAPNKLDLICTARVVPINSSFEDFLYARKLVRFLEREYSPPFPPPRAAVA